jgi:hypothetical protein
MPVTSVRNPDTGKFEKVEGEIVLTKKGTAVVPEGFKLTKIATGALGAVKREAGDQKHTLYA